MVCEAKQGAGFYRPRQPRQTPFYSRTLETNPNKRMHANRRPALGFRCAGYFGRRTRGRRPTPAAVGDP
jgi:hypothetical protein